MNENKPAKTMSLCLFFTEAAQQQKHFDHSSLFSEILQPEHCYCDPIVEISRAQNVFPPNPSTLPVTREQMGTKAGYGDVGLWPRVCRSITMMAIRHVPPGALDVVSLWGLSRDFYFTLCDFEGERLEAHCCWLRPFVTWTIWATAFPLFSVYVPLQVKV